MIQVWYKTNELLSIGFSNQARRIIRYRSSHAMSERFITSLKLISSHILLILVLLLASGFLSNYGFLFLIIPQTVLLILYFSGYREFFGLRFRRIYRTSAPPYSAYQERFTQFLAWKRHWHPV